MKKHIHYCILSIFTLFIGLTMLAQQDNQEPYLVQQLIETFIKKGNLPGVSIAVSKNEKIIYAKGFGYADIDLKKPMTPQSQLRTASVAKVITTTALGRLISEGRIDIDMPIKTYVPYIQKNYEHLTIRQLTGHTSGLAHRPKGKKYKKKQYTSVKETVNLMKAPLLFVPDTQYQYSTHAFNLVAAAIEGASGKSFETYLKEDVFTALDMQQTFAEDIRQLSTIDATLYYLKKEKLLKEKLTNASYKLAGAGFRSTPTDLLKMMHGYTNNFIALDTRKTLFDSHTLKDGTKTQVGITWRTSFDAFGNKVIEHAGSWRGTRTVIVHYPEDNLNIVIMINADCPVFIEETAHIIAQLFRDIPKKGPTVFCKKENIKVLVNMNGVEKQLEGNLRMEGSHGMLDIQNAHPIVLAGTPIIYLGYGTHYTAITANGLLYLQMGSTSVIQGRLFLYNTRNKTYPTTHTPFATFMLDPS